MAAAPRFVQNAMSMQHRNQRREREPDLSLTALWMPTTAGMSTSCGCQPLRFIALKNICCEGYSQKAVAVLLGGYTDRFRQPGRQSPKQRSYSDNQQKSVDRSYLWCCGVSEPLGMDDVTLPVGKARRCPAAGRCSAVAGIMFVKFTGSSVSAETSRERDKRREWLTRCGK